MLTTRIITFLVAVFISTFAIVILAMIFVAVDHFRARHLHPPDQGRD